MCGVVGEESVEVGDYLLPDLVLRDGSVDSFDALRVASCSFQISCTDALEEIKGCIFLKAVKVGGATTVFLDALDCFCDW